MTGLNGLKLLERRSTSDHICDELRQMIIEGSLSPGEQLGEARIAQQMGVSRAPVREALQQLVQEKLLVAARNKGVSVVTFTAVDVWEIYDARCAIESHAARRVVAQGPGAQARASEALRSVNTQLRSAANAGDHRRISAADLDFHLTLVAAAENTRLVDAYAILSAQALACVNRLEILPSGSEVIEDHQRLIDLLAAGEREALLTSINDHLTLAAQHLIMPRRTTSEDGSS